VQHKRHRVYARHYSTRFKRRNQTQNKKRKKKKKKKKKNGTQRNLKSDSKAMDTNTKEAEDVNNLRSARIVHVNVGMDTSQQKNKKEHRHDSNRPSLLRKNWRFGHAETNRLRDYATKHQKSHGACSSTSAFCGSGLQEA
jgi:hypothetical protein